MEKEFENINIVYVLNLDGTKKEYFKVKELYEKLGGNIDKIAFNKFRNTIGTNKKPSEKVTIKIYPNNIFNCIMPNGDMMKYPK